MSNIDKKMKTGDDDYNVMDCMIKREKSYIIFCCNLKNLNTEFASKIIVIRYMGTMLHFNQNISTF